MRWETWVYGNGDTARTSVTAADEHGAAHRFLKRRVFGSQGYGPYTASLLEQGVETVKICVKNPGKTGSRKNPNYPTVYTFTYTEEEEWVLTGTS